MKGLEWFEYFPSSGPCCFCPIFGLPIMEIAALTQGRDFPSTRFRIRQCIEPLNDLGISVTEYCPSISQYFQLPGIFGAVRRRYLPPVLLAQGFVNFFMRIPGTIRSRNADLVWISRTFIPGMNDLVFLTGKPRILDVDDAIWLSDPLGKSALKRMARHMDGIVVGNNFLANWFSPYCKNISVVPTGVNCDIFCPPNTRSADGVFTVGWIGTSSNFTYLEMVRSSVNKFLNSHQDSRLLVVADRCPNWIGENPQHLFVKWHPDSEIDMLQQMDVGLMPLENSEWARGKCSYKMLQYMATGIPVVVSPVGMNVDVMSKGEIGIAANTDSDWLDALNEIYSNRDRWQQAGEAGRRVVGDFYSTDVVSKNLAKIFKEVSC